MTPTFIDTSYIIALALTDDAYHEAAMAWRARCRGPFVSTEYVLIEIADCLRYERVRSLATESIRLMRADRSIQIVPASTALMSEGLAYFGRYSDKQWSLTDCISFIVMQRDRLSDALTSDHDFEHAGFRALLRENSPGGP